MKFKKVLSLILTACLIISMLSVFAFAEPEDDYAVEDTSGDTADGEDGTADENGGDGETTTPRRCRRCS